MSLAELTRNFGGWADETFENPPIQAYGRKLAHEVHELNDDLKGFMEHTYDPDHANIGAELADCLLVLCAIANRAGVDLELEARKKFEINKGRTWIKQADGTHQHVKTTK
jgi:NTP pyrophosphatase (non-canonical NTP hydrolase)